MNRQTNKPPLLHILIATGFGSGFSPVAPGTAGALLATIIWLVLSFLLPHNYLCIITFALIVAFTILGIWSANKLEPFWGEDPSRVVVDEMVGVWIPLLGVAEKNMWYVSAAFVLFRLFDICKPLGIRRMENLKGGVGIMMDDVLAGIYSLLIILGARWVIG
ncbi:phosphatidylglycerophosphatase A [Bacteroides sp. OttesenSCG-928-D19]|nr:phosphatidylglycerophosphatase A [Bacteroides sp. OttesenSCG-928-N06]MDL2305520.1 phosphatidylglycerophosphatase A [Bacteroides sp. OttesenSCG-928-D19]